MFHKLCEKQCLFIVIENIFLRISLIFLITNSRHSLPIVLNEQKEKKSVVLIWIVLKRGEGGVGIQLVEC